MESFRRRLLAGSIAIIAVVAFGTGGYWLLGDGRWSWFECFYMTVITISTVGYGETLAGMDGMTSARAFTALLLLFGTGTLVYAVSTLTAFIVEGDLREALKRSRRMRRISAMKDHIVVCGAGSTGRHIIIELCAAGHSVVAIDTQENVLRELAAEVGENSLSYLVGDATDDALLVQGGVERARGLVTSMSHDKDNLYVVVTARQMAPRLRIVARCAELTHVEKIRRAGADAVVSPNHIGGMRMASELLRPGAVRFLDDMLRDRQQQVRIEDVTVTSPCASLADLGLDGYGLLVLALRAPAQASWQYRPSPTTPVASGTTLVLLGEIEQVARLRSALGGEPAVSVR